MFSVKEIYFVIITKISVFKNQAYTHRNENILMLVKTETYLGCDLLQGKKQLRKSDLVK